MHCLAVAAEGTDNAALRLELRPYFRERLPDLLFDIEPLAVAMIAASQKIDVLFVDNVNSYQNGKLRFVATLGSTFYLCDKFRHAGLSPSLQRCGEKGVIRLAKTVLLDRHAKVRTAIDFLTEVRSEHLILGRKRHFSTVLSVLDLLVYRDRLREVEQFASLKVERT